MLVIERVVKSRAESATRGRVAERGKNSAIAIDRRGCSLIGCRRYVSARGIF